MNTFRCFVKSLGYYSQLLLSLWATVDFTWSCRCFRQGENALNWVAGKMLWGWCHSTDRVFPSCPSTDKMVICPEWRFMGYSLLLTSCPLMSLDSILLITLHPLMLFWFKQVLLALHPLSLLDSSTQDTAQRERKEHWKDRSTCIHLILIFWYKNTVSYIARYRPTHP